MDVDGSVPLTSLSQEVALAIAFFNCCMLVKGRKGESGPYCGQSII